MEYDVTKTDFYVIGIDISRTYVKLILTNMKLCVLKKEDFQFYQKPVGACLLSVKKQVVN